MLLRRFDRRIGTLTIVSLPAVAVVPSAVESLSVSLYVVSGFVFLRLYLVDLDGTLLAVFALSSKYKSKLPPLSLLYDVVLLSAAVDIPTLISSAAVVIPVFSAVNGIASSSITDDVSLLLHRLEDNYGHRVTLC